LLSLEITSDDNPYSTSQRPRVHPRSIASRPKRERRHRGCPENAGRCETRDSPFSISVDSIVSIGELSAQVRTWLGCTAIAPDSGDHGAMKLEGLVFVGSAPE